MTTTDLRQAVSASAEAGGLQNCDPRIARKAVLDNPQLRRSLEEISEKTGVGKKRLERSAARYIRELVPGNSRFGYRLLIRFGRFVYTRGYDRDISVEDEQVRKLRQLARDHPIALVCNHRSQVDSFSIFCALHDNDLPHPFTFGGINMKIPVMGNILKGGGLVFIRRAFQNNLVYKAVLLTYIDFLVQQRLPLFWAIEGTRSRTGKLVPPRFGLLSWVINAQHRVSREDLRLVPVAVSYEQIADVQSYSEEQRGAKKKPENFRWLIKYLASFKHPMGKISVRFGEAVSVHEQMDQIRRNSPEILEQSDKVVRKIVIAACLRMNDATPVTVPSLICLTLLRTAPKAITRRELELEFARLISYVKANNWPTTFDLQSEPNATLQSALASLEANGVIECFSGGAEAVYSISPGKDLSASYYRNNAIHFFVNGAIADLALSKALSEKNNAKRESAFWNELAHLRNMFRFEFYFSRNQRFNEQIRCDLDLRCPGWRDLLASETPYPWRELTDVTPLLCHGVLEPFVDAYQVVASNLMRLPAGSGFEKSAFIQQCMGEAEQLYRLKRIAHQETVAQAMFESGLLVAKNRGLIEQQADGPDLNDNRREFEQEVNELSRRLQDIRHIAATRQTNDRASLTD